MCAETHKTRTPKNDDTIECCFNLLRYMSEHEERIFDVRDTPWLGIWLALTIDEMGRFVVRWFKVV